MIKQEEVYRIGRLGKPHGVHGEISMQYVDDVFDAVDADYLVLDVDGILVPFFIEEYRFRSEAIVLMKFCDVDTEQKARELTGSVVYFPRVLAEESTENLSWAQIIGFTLVEDSTQKSIGTIRGVDDSTVNILFEVEREDGSELLIPASPDLIQNVDAKAKNVCMQIPQGLLDL